MVDPLNKPISLLIVEDEDARQGVKALWQFGYIGQMGNQDLIRTDNALIDLAEDIIDGGLEYSGVDLKVATSLSQACNLIEQSGERFTAVLTDVRLDAGDRDLPPKLSTALQDLQERSNWREFELHPQSVLKYGGIYIWALYGRQLQMSGCHMLLYSSAQVVRDQYTPFFLSGAEPRLFLKAGDHGDGLLGWDFVDSLKDIIAPRIAAIVEGAANRVSDMLNLRDRVRALMASASSAAQGQHMQIIKSGIQGIAVQPLAGTDAVNVVVPWIQRVWNGPDHAGELRELESFLASISLVQIQLDDMYYDFCRNANIAHTNELIAFIQGLNSSGREYRSSAEHRVTVYLEALGGALKHLKSLENELSGLRLEITSALIKLEDGLSTIRGRMSLHRAGDLVEPTKLDEIRGSAQHFKDELDAIYKPQETIREWINQSPGVGRWDEYSAGLDEKGKYDGRTLPKLPVLPDLLRQLLFSWHANTSGAEQTRAVGLKTDVQQGELVLLLQCAPRKMTRDQLESFGTIADSDKEDVWAQGAGSCRIADLHGGYIVLRSGEWVRDSRASTAIPAERNKIRSSSEGTVQEVHLPFVSGRARAAEVDTGLGDD